MSTFRCAAASLDRSEALAGTASTVRAYVLLQCPVRWGRDVLRDAPMPAQVRSHLANAARRGVKVLLIRRHGRTGASEGARLFAAYADPDRPWLETAALDSLDQLVDHDLATLADGISLGLEPMDQPLVCVCTHGRHDVCCAELGRPIARALHHSHPGLTWEVSHIGGDRFAGNLLLLPHGLYYGRVDPETAPRLVQEHLEGRINVEHLRGRSSLATAVQAADCFLRRHLDETSLDAVRVTGRTRDADVWTVRFARGAQTWLVRVRVTRQDVAQLTCRAAEEHSAPTYELVDVRPAGRPPD